MSETDSSTRRRLPLGAGFVGSDVSSRGVGRRQLLQSVLGGIGAGLTMPVLTGAHPIEQHLADAAKVAEADAKANAPTWKPEFLDRHQFDTLEMMAELIVPGSSRARVSQFVDQLLAVDTTANQRTFLNAMGAFEGMAITRFGHPWKALTQGQQRELLGQASTEAPGQPEKPPRPGTTVLTQAPAEPVRITLRDHFDHLKGWIAGAYYSSEIGMRELGWTGQMFFESFPGCPHPDGHL
jgi:hypothetical protein